MKILAPLEAMSAGTPYAESFHSVLQRLAATHNVSFTRLLTFIKAINETSTRARVFDLAGSLMGTGAGARGLVATYHELSGAPDLTGHTLLYLANVISPRATWAFTPSQRWCPICINPDKAEGYGQFAHMLRQVHSCRLHNMRLRSLCPECDRPQSYIASIALHPLCSHCRAPLWTKSSDGAALSRYDAWAEGQLYELVGYLSDRDRAKPSGTWLVDAADTLRQLGDEAIARFQGRDSSQAKLLRRQPKYGYSLPILLWLAATHSTNLVDIILRPREVLSGVFPQLAPVRRQGERRYVSPAEGWQILEELARRLISQQPDVWLPALSTLSPLLGFEGLYARNRELTLRYNKARAQQVRGAIALECDRRFVLLALEGLSVRKVKHYALERILSRKQRELPAVHQEMVAKAAEIARAGIGMFVVIPSQQLQVCRSPVWGASRR